MANVNEKVSRNVPGPYYVDATCIDCDLCRAVAPQIFDRDPEAGCSFVHHQPSNVDEIALAEEARTSCPCECIGRDGA